MRTYTLTTFAGGTLLDTCTLPANPDTREPLEVHTLIAHGEDVGTIPSSIVLVDPDGKEYRLEIDRRDTAQPGREFLHGYGIGGSSSGPLAHLFCTVVIDYTRAGVSWRMCSVLAPYGEAA